MLSSRNGSEESWECYSSMRTYLRTSWTEKNSGQRYFRCAQYGKCPHCKYFEWFEPRICEHDSSGRVAHIGFSRPTVRLKSWVMGVVFWLQQASLLSILFGLFFFFFNIIVIIIIIGAPFIYYKWFFHNRADKKEKMVWMAYILLAKILIVTCKISSCIYG